MTDYKVKISDILVPDVWDEYFFEKTTEKSNLIESGIVVRDPYMDEIVRNAGNTVNLPFFNDLTGDDEVMSDAKALSTAKIGTAQDIARMHLRAKAWSVNDLSGALSGTDPLAIIVNRVLNYWQLKEQALLLASLKGVFADNADNDDGDLIHTHAAEATGSVVLWNGSSPTVMCPEAIIDGQALLGDAQDRFVAIMMHSKCYTDLLKQELIDFERPSGSPAEIPFYIGKRVIVNDLCPRRNGTESGTNNVYRSFLFAEGAIARGEGLPPMPSELQRVGLQHDTQFITRRHFILHPRGIKFTSSDLDLVEGAAPAAPSNADCEKAANWDRVYAQKNLRIAMIETN
jgi:hypothetical protein